jgi:bacterioferritin
MLMDRIFMQDGVPNLQDLAKILLGEDVCEALACNLKADVGAQATIKAGIAHCESVRDYVSLDLLHKILDDTEEHIEFLETQIDLIAKVGLQNYLQSQMGELN